MRTGERAQTSLDLVIGISIFLTIVAGIFLFVPGALEPYSGSAQEEIVTADRVADTLTEATLAEPGTPYVLNTTCTTEYFDSLGSVPPGCDIPGSSYEETVGLSSQRSLNLTIRGKVSSSSDSDTILCWEAATETLLPVGATACDINLTAGSTPPSGSGSAATVRRVVDINGTDVFMVVKIW